ncbi:hypothetical protein I7I53_06693 [Histoplasma capsulatum var. duboisii H88]|uniref:Uncharacterized protein n=1 Tax=Ajellomyces capsulatus (strain H88) TaxID=544711 RepID=A0A8A1LFF1_AJEC8|nr:hypothetical protein I7I53_06693 [Histoplasma capsulatum var. duboisii H88]
MMGLFDIFSDSNLFPLSTSLLERFVKQPIMNEFPCYTMSNNGAHNPLGFPKNQKRPLDWIFSTQA